MRFLGDSLFAKHVSFPLYYKERYVEKEASCMKAVFRWAAPQDASAIAGKDLHSS